MLKPRLDIHFSVGQQACYFLGKPYRPNHSEFMLDHSRSAIILALRSLELPQGTGVGMMAYNCHTVMNAIKNAGCAPVFIDVNDDLTINVEDLRKKKAFVSVVIVTHLFGIVNDVQSIKTEFPTLLIIEDCAHAYGIEHFYGDFATFSFGQGKFPSLGNGGMLVVNNRSYYDKVKCNYDQLPAYSIGGDLRLFTRLLVNSFLYRPWVYGGFTLPVKQRRNQIRGMEMIRPKRISRGVSAMYESEKKRIPEVIKKRFGNAEKQVQLVSKDINRYYIGVNAFMLVTCCDDPRLLQEKLRKSHIDSATHFAHALDWAIKFGYHRGDCPNTEKLINRLLMIPIY